MTILRFSLIIGLRARGAPQRTARAAEKDPTMTTTDTTASPLTAQDIKVLRSADALCYRLDTKGDVSQIEAIKEASRDNPWEQRKVLPIAFEIENYEKGVRVVGAWVRLPRYKWDATPLGTLLDLLRPGDELSARLITGNNNGYMTEAGLHRDEFVLQLTRGKKKMLFLLEVSVCPQNSARMARIENTYSDAQG
jgi:hypothetical protein